MFFIDTNIAIYIANGTLDPLILKSAKDPMGHSVIVRIEAEGYHRAVASEIIQLKDIFSTSKECSLSGNIVETTISIRQRKKMSLGDAIIAATAIANDAVLWTANTQDFEGIDDLKLYNPLEEVVK